jgi:uncharacterized surface protein with fasciclin (FAS1) repeats
VAEGSVAKPLNEALAGASGFSTMARAIKDTGLDGVFDGKAHYTLLAPTDAAFAALGKKGTALQQPEQRAALAALVRAHIVPGDLLTEDIGKALDRASGKPVKLHAMDKSTLTLTRDGDRISVTGPDGAKAMITGQTTKATNGAVIGLDGVLKKAN